MKPIQLILAVAVISFSLIIGSQVIPLQAKENTSKMSSQIAEVFRADSRSQLLDGTVNISFKVFRNGFVHVKFAEGSSETLVNFVKEKLSHLKLTPGSFSGKVIKAELVF